MGRKRYSVEQVIHLNGSCELNVMSGSYHFKSGGAFGRSVHASCKEQGRS